MKKILVGTDLSDRSRPALERALQLASRHGGKVTVLHVAHQAIPAHAVEALLEQRREAVKVELAATAQAARCEVEPIAAWGDPVAEMLRHVDKTGCDLVLLGVRSKRLRDSFRGTTAERIGRNIKIPSLIVTADGRNPYKTVLAAIDGGVCARNALRYVHTLVPEASLSVLHAYRDTSPDMRASALALAQSEIGAAIGDATGAVALVRPVARDGDLIAAIADECRSRSSELLAIGVHGRPTIARALWGSRSIELLRAPPCDVLIGTDPA